MWEDDAKWLPIVLEGKGFRGFFEFDGEKMLSHHVDVVDYSEGLQPLH